MKRDSLPRASISGSSVRWGMLPYLVVIATALVLGGGCSKQRANLSLNKSRKLLLDAEKREAQRLEPENYEDTKKQIEEAERLVSEKKYKQALERAGRAVEKAKQTLENSRKKLAAQRLTEAKEALAVADRNNGVQIDQQRYNGIKELYTKAQEKHSKNKWDDVISVCDQLKSEVETLLAQLLTEAKNKQQMAQLKFREMKDVGAEEYAPNYVINVQDTLRTIEKHINVDRDYQGALNLADEAIRKCEEGITATKGKMAQEQITKIEDGLADAVNKGAPIYAKDLLQNCNESFDAILEQYYQKKYDKVLDSAKFLGPKVDKLIHTTRLKSAEAKIQTVVKEIDSLDEGGARQYLPGRVEVIEDHLQKARDKFQQEQFEEAEEECLAGLREGEKIRSAFNDLALDAMRNAAETLDISRNVFDKMADIFIVGPDVEGLSGLDLKFEQNKAAMKQELDDILNNATYTLGIARLQQEKRKYRKAIELAGEIKQASEYVLNETYHVVAHNAVMELASEVTKRETDGAREYASEELDRTRTLLEQAKDLMKDKQYKEAVRKASETRAQLDLTTQKLAQKAVENMNNARREISEAENYRTREYQKSELERAESLLNESQEALRSRRLKPALEIALEASEVAKKASENSARIWCQEILAEAQSAISKAEEAGSLNYAAEITDEAKRFYATAQNLFESGNYIEGKNVALRAVQKARDALYKNVNTAEAAINEAKSYDGWKYNYSLLSQAIVDAKMARQAIERGDHFSSSSYADKATLEARKVVKQAKKQSFEERVDAINSGMDHAMHSGANYFQTKDAKSIYRELADVEENYTEEKYDLLSSRLDKLDADLEKVVSSTPEVLDKLLAIQRKRLARQKETMAVDFAPDLLESAERHIRYAGIDYDKGHFSQSYRDLKIVIKNLDEVDNRLEMESYASKVDLILRDLSDLMNQFDPVLRLNPDTLYSFTKGPQGEGHYISIASKIKPDEFRKEVTDLYHRGKLLESPKNAHAVHQLFMDMLNDIRLASIYFDKLIILDEYEPTSRREIIEKAYGYIDRAKGKRSEIQKTFLNREQKMRLVSIH